MRLLVHEWDSITKRDIYKALREEDIEFDIINLVARNLKTDEEEAEFKEKFEKKLKSKSYDAVFSINFFPNIAEICYVNNIMYIAWAYDSPAFGGESRHHYYKTNRVFLFDSAELDRHKGQNKQHLYHLNLATDVRRMNSIKMTPMQQLRFQSDISFVGQMYPTELIKTMEVMNPYAVGFVQALIDIQMKSYNSDLITELITPEVMNVIKSPELIEVMDEYSDMFQVDKGILSIGGFRLFLQRSVSNRERLMLIALLSKHYPVKIFSPDRYEIFENVKYAGLVDYMTEMPLVFRSSKINLNITAKNIETGIPQRCIDIMGCHGFLLTNYQADLFTELEEDKDVVVYRSVEEALDKAGFYLKHDKLRREIAENGYKKVRDCFSYHSQLGKIWKITGLR